MTMAWRGGCRHHHPLISQSTWQPRAASNNDMDMGQTMLCNHRHWGICDHHHMSEEEELTDPPCWWSWFWGREHCEFGGCSSRRVHLVTGPLASLQQNGGFETCIMTRWRRGVVMATQSPIKILPPSAGQQYTCPIHQPPSRLPLAKQAEVDEMLQDRKGWWVVSEVSDHPWSSLMSVRKKKRDLQICVDYQWLNDVTNKDWLLPATKNRLHPYTLDSDKWYSTLNLESGYWQVALHPSNKDKTGRQRRLPSRGCCCNTLVMFEHLRNPVKYFEDLFEIWAFLLWRSEWSTHVHQTKVYCVLL
jgi:hypothetical protein